MPKRDFVVRYALFTSVLLASCGTESPTATEAGLSAGSFAAAKQPGSCTFTTPNGKTHTVPANSARCQGSLVREVAGTYELTRFTFRQLEWQPDGETRAISDVYDIADFLGEDGAQFRLILEPNGTTSGRLYVPADPDEDGSGADLDLAGSWRLDGGTIVLDTTADTFFDQLPFTYADGRLTAGPATVGEEDDPLFVEEVILTQQ